MTQRLVLRGRSTSDHTRVDASSRFTDHVRTLKWSQNCLITNMVISCYKQTRNSSRSMLISYSRRPIEHVCAWKKRCRKRSNTSWHTHTRMRGDCRDFWARERNSQQTFWQSFDYHASVVLDSSLRESNHAAALFHASFSDEPTSIGQPSANTLINIVEDRCDQRQENLW